MNLNDFFQSSADLFASNKPKGLYTEKLTFKAGNEYLVRLLPYIKEGRSGYNKSVYHFYQYSWHSIKDGRWTYVLSPRTFGEPCPITEYYFTIKNSGNEKLFADISKRLTYRENWYYNVLVVDDPVNPENNGKVKILQAGRQLQNIIEGACSTDPKKEEQYAEEFDVENMRKAIFDLSPEGINLNIRVEPQGDFVSYKSSAFVRRKRDLGLSESEMDDILNSTYDLTTIERTLSSDDVEKIFLSTFLGACDNKEVQVKKKSEPISVQVDEKVDNSEDTLEELDSEEETNDDKFENVSMEELENFLKNEADN